MKILVGYDGSNASQKALNLAKQHAAIWQGRIEVIQAIARNATLSYDKIEKAEKQLAQLMKSILAGNRIRFKTTLLVGAKEPGEQIVNFAETFHADEIIIGSRKRSKIGKFVLGSTTQFVVLNAPCPVVLVK